MQIDDSPAAADVSFAEEQLWLADRGDRMAQPFLDCTPSMSVAARLDGSPDVEALEASLNDVVQRQDVLRSRFFTRGGRLMRLYDPSAVVTVTTVDLRSLAEDDPAPLVEGALARHRNAPFDLSSAPLLRAMLVTLRGEQHILSIALPHIVFDRWSKRVLALELNRHYEAHIARRAPRVEPLTFRYHDYVRWQRHRLEGSLGRQLCEYWKTRLSGLPDLRLPGDGVGVAPALARSGALRFAFSAADVGRLGALSRRSRVTMATLMLAIFKVFLHQISGQTDIAVGVPLSDRRRPEVEPLIGLFMNLVVVRTTIAPDMTFLGGLDRVRRALVDASRYQDMPHGYLVRLLRAPGPLCRVVFSFMPALPPTVLELPGSRATPVWMDSEPPSLASLSIRLLHTPGGLKCRFVYKADEFSAALIRRFATHLQTLVAAILDAPEKPVRAYELGDHAAS